jgi:hypothetical protein
MWAFCKDAIWTWLAVAMMIAAIVGYSCVTAPPAPCVGSCSPEPCTSDIGCGFDCFCIKFGDEQWGSCARTDW